MSIKSRECFGKCFWHAVTFETVFSATFVTSIASDGIWSESESKIYSPLYVD